MTDAQGNAKGSIEDSLVKLIGPESIIGVSDIICILDVILLHMLILGEANCRVPRRH